jgi:CheY-like chemotaxis protein
MPGAVPPDALFMDLAMPGIDGWETLRRLRAARRTGAGRGGLGQRLRPQAGQRPVGLPPEDFLVKPVRLPELLDWLGARLALQWVTLDRPAPMPSCRQPKRACHRRHACRRLRAGADLGYVRGIGQQLDAIEAADPAHAAFVARLRAMAREYRFDAMTDLLKRALDERPA